ncbi:39S ribosomal protein L34, mitochondrial-like [Teleopsis dalmanni]|uniref:39S ribosomal protein L34, mitochondrial-like n=1 Tax=Teleopsis dalmanni TaxID=139649 RepID=UPI0018CD841D|nr:39S ribosomal protein L34, mitochondrial-like [Teleopsis dalmanni]XP_037954871.1 39S ribosomal protein L34, mitochondrial-like [Teleopsis dalmanni]
MFVNLLQRVSASAISTAQLLFTREAHVFNRAVIKAKVRTHFPKPREVKRINVHGWEQRMSTPGGRKIIMRRILLGKHCLSH